MISVLIPVYNFDVRPLVKSLIQQFNTTGIDGEIVCLDDGSSSTYLTLNKEIASYPAVQYKELPSNIGRSAIRNKLAALATNPNLLFIDCDSECLTDQYISNYIKHIDNYEVLYGGRTYLPEPPDDDTYFRWYYGTHREVTTSNHRSKSPYKSFMTNNFLIRKDIFDAIQFHETLTQYGHEDTLFGLELMKREVEITHIENPLLHIGLETTEAFLSKTRKGVENLLYLYRNHLITENVKLLKAYKFLVRTHMVGQVAKKYENKSAQWTENFKSGSPNLRLFDLYKLGYMCYISETSDNNS